MTTEEKIRIESLEYHKMKPCGKMETIPTKPHSSSYDLTLAYSPGVAYPCLEIEKNPEDVYKYTSKGNLVAVISNGTAVLGLGDIGAAAGKPVMEGKGLLFKTFADIDVFDIEIDSHDVEEIIKTVKLIAPTFGGINLEDIKAPECFEIERRLIEETDIPVMHDDQHGTAIISGAALLNGVEIVDKSIADLKVVVSGAGASGIACSDHYVALGVKPENIWMCDSRGLITKARVEKGEVNEHKAKYAQDAPEGKLGDVIEGADVFLGLSIAGAMSQEMVMKMAPDPMIFAMANPIPEILPEVAKEVRPDAITATGRSDYPNQVNNVLGFPFIFRGALDVRSRDITPGMKMAATKALAELAKEPVPEDVMRAYGGVKLTFGREYLIPKPFDPRVLIWEASAVAEAAVNEGVAMVTPEEFDIDAYREELESRQGAAVGLMRGVIKQARVHKKRIVMPEGDEEKMIIAAAELVKRGICEPVLIGHENTIDKIKKDLKISEQFEIITPLASPNRDTYAKAMVKKRERKGMTMREAERVLDNPLYFAAQMVSSGDADGFIGGITHHYPTVLKPLIRTVGLCNEVHRLLAAYLVVLKKRALFIADVAVNISPDPQTLAEIAVQTAMLARRFGIEPRVAMLSFSNFGSTRHPETDKMAEAVRLARKLDPDLEIDGEMQADTALVEEILKRDYPFSNLTGPANVLVCPNLAAANIGYKLLKRIANAELIGPILEGLAKPMQVLQRGDDVRDIVNMAAICALEAARMDGDPCCVDPPE